MRFVRWLVAIAIVAAICWLFPLFHIVPLHTAVAAKQAETFDATKFAERFWSEKLLPATSKAVTAEVLLPAIQQNAASAKTNYAHSLGLSDSYIYFLRGKGKVLSASDDEIAVVVTGDSTNADVVLEIGPLFGNTVRDASGSLNASDYPNSQDFNDIAAALNRIVETQVFPKLHGAKVGAKISFAGCAEVDDESTDLKPLKVIPIQAELR